jgi:hypothetical protein
MFDMSADLLYSIYRETVKYNRSSYPGLYEEELIISLLNNEYIEEMELPQALSIYTLLHNIENSDDEDDD